MKFVYHRGNNFGDKLNPYIFSNLIPNLLKSENSNKAFVGIGSLLGFSMVKDISAEKIIFSSGWGFYGEAPEIDESWNFACVRGPLTAEFLGIDMSYAVADGALLLYDFDLPKQNRKYKYSYMPHHRSLDDFDWSKACKEAGFNYISPLIETEDAIKQIMQSEVLYSEAMHGAIVADTLRVPWIPVKAYPEIVEFKWRDWAASVNVPYEPVRLSAVFSEQVIESKVGRRVNDLPIVAQLGSYAYKKYQNNYVYPKLLQAMEDMKRKSPHLSKESVVQDRCQELNKRLEKVRSLELSNESHTGLLDSVYPASVFERSTITGSYSTQKMARHLRSGASLRGGGATADVRGRCTPTVERRLSQFVI